MPRFLSRAYSALIEDEEDHGCRELPDSACREVPENAARLVGGLTLQTLGDRIADPKTTLSWLLTAVGAPGFVVAMLVPVREAGSLLPQTALVGFVRRFPKRSRLWAAAAVGQGIAVAVIGFGALIRSGLAAGVVVLIALGAFALFRAVGSITSKDTLGKTIPRGNRGSITGISSSVAGLAAIGAGLLISVVEGAGTAVLALVVAGASLLWLGAAAVFATVVEEPSAGEDTDPAVSAVESLALLRTDRPFRRFVVARTLLFVTALSPPLVVTLSAAASEGAVSGVGGFVVAGGVAGLVSSPVWGRLSDRSSRSVMAMAAAAGGAIVLCFLGLRLVGFGDAAWLGPATFFLLAVTHAGARMGRKTYVVDLGRGDDRTRYVAVSNTVIGAALLLVGLAGALVAAIGTEWALFGLALAGLAGAVVARALPEIHG